jgi:quercetin dioxygenase-like cupin family protein
LNQLSQTLRRAAEYDAVRTHEFTWIFDTLRIPTTLKLWSVMPVINIEDVRIEEFGTGRTYQTLVGDDEGSTPVRIGIQTSPPGYSTGTHSHPYMEVITVIEGTGEAWIEGEGVGIPIGPGSTIVAPPNKAHGFRNTGQTPMRSYGVHASPIRITDRDAKTSG